LTFYENRGYESSGARSDQGNGMDGALGFGFH
jgi:hypothetical protein